MIENRETLTAPQLNYWHNLLFQEILAQEDRCVNE